MFRNRVDSTRHKPEPLGRDVWRVGIVVLFGSVMSILDTTIVNVALETLGKDLHAGLDQIQWIVTGYMLSLAALIPLTGWAARRFGAKQVYLTSLVLFTASSALCGLAPSVGALIGFRVLQGVGGGMLMPIGQLMMADVAGPKRMGRVMSLIGIPTMLAPILGPTIGGAIVDNLSWRWIFFVNVPIGIVAVAAAWRALPRVPRAKADPLDIRGLLLISTGVPLVTYGLAEIGDTGGVTSGKVIIPIIAGLILVAIFIVHALRVRFPLLDLRLYRRATFSAASFAVFAMGAAVFGSMILLPLYWQSVRGETAIHTGLLLAPQGIGMALFMPLAGKLTDRYGGGPLAVFGVTLAAVMTIPFAFIGPDTSIVFLSFMLALRGIGIGFSFMPVMAAAFASLERSELSHATPQLNVLMRIGSSMGVALLTVVLQRSLDGADTLGDQASAYGTAFWAAVALIAAAIVPSVILLRAERQARARRAQAPPPAEQQEALLEAAAV
jgi:EmrB/QacA subfamily drug resistance transporter